MNIDISKYIPNTLVAAPGERDLADKLNPFISLAMVWFEKYFCALAILKEEGSEEENDKSASVNVRSSAYELAMRIICAEAYRQAVPQLDLVLTANGFATVDSKNVVPASKARTDRLLEGLLQYRDDNIIALLYVLPQVAEWIDTAQAQFFSNSLFNNPEQTRYLELKELSSLPGSSWEKYLALLPYISDAENSLADEWFSPELMKALRLEALAGSSSDMRSAVILRIKSQIAEFFKSGSFKSRALGDILNIIRKHPAVFPEWIASETSANFFPPVFKNKKSDTAYFF